MENVLVFVSIVIGVAVTDMLVSLHRLLRARRQVRWDWLPLVVAFLVLLTIVQMWWGIAQPGAKSLTIGAFLPSLVELVLLFLLASASLPDEVPAEGLDLKTYYHENGADIWSLFSLALGWLISLQTIAAYAHVGLVRAVQPQLVEFGILGLMISAIFIRNRWWHMLVLLLLASGPIGWLSRSLG